MELFVRTDTDTAHPRSAVPIFLVHSITNPCCNVPSCWCHASQVQVLLLLEHAKTGNMTICTVVNNTIVEEA